MSDTEPRGWVGIVTSLLKQFPVICLLFGAFFLILAASNGLSFKEVGVAVANDTWRYASAAAGTLLILAGFGFYLLERKAVVAKVPGPYLTTFPVTIDKPRDRELLDITDWEKAIRFTILSKERPPPGYELRLMFMGKNEEFAPYYGAPRFSALPTGGYAWEYELSLNPGAKAGERRKFAMFYAGPFAQKLIAHHETVCRYFAKDGNPRWPLITVSIPDCVRCSQFTEVTFKSVPRPPKQPRPATVP